MSFKQSEKIIEGYKKKEGQFWYQLTIWNKKEFSQHAIGYLERDNISYQWKQHPKNKLWAIFTEGKTFERIGQGFLRTEK